MDWPASGAHLPIICSVSLEAIGSNLLGQQAGTAAGAAAWPSANQAVYVPFALRSPFLVRQLWWANGSTSGNIDCGIYSAAGTKIVSTGSVAQSGAAAIQTVDITDILLGPGSYYMALVGSSTGSQMLRHGFTAIVLRVCGVAEEASALPLPAVMTPAARSTSHVPLFGLNSRTLI